MPDPRVRPTQQHSAAGATVTIDGEASPSAVWRTLATADSFKRALVDAVRELLAGTHHSQRVSCLVDAGVTALDGGYARLVTGLERAPETDAYQRAVDLTAAFGQGEETPLGERPPLSAVSDGPLAVLEAADIVPTLTVHVTPDVRQRPRDQRERLLELVARLGRVADVRLVATTLTARWLAETHRAELPAEFSDAVTARHDSNTPVADAVAAAREAFDPNSRAVGLLRDLADEPGETVAYTAVKSAMDVSAGRISQLLGALEEYDLARRYGPRTNKRVELTPAGRAFVDALDEEIGRQRRLDSLESEFSTSGQAAHKCRVTTRTGPAPPDGCQSEQPPASAATAPYRTRYLDRPSHAAAAGGAANGGITTVEAPLPEATDAEDRHTRFVSYDDGRDEAVIAIRATAPLQYVTSAALALASPRLIDNALPADRLDALDDPPVILRDARCIGGLSAEAADDGQVLRDTLVEWGEDLADMTTKLHHGEYEDRDRFRSEIMRSAHGLAGTIVHLLDAVGVDLVRELRVPGYPSHDRLADLAQTVSIATAIQSKYGAFAAYRQLFEDRPEKRTSALSPAVDAADPTGEYIGGLVIRGPRAHRLGQHVEAQLTDPAPIHEDAPEFAVRIPVTTPDRSAFAEAVTRMCAEKNLSATREAVTLYRALTDDVYAATEAVHWLQPEDEPRDIRLDEVRVSLACLDADRLLPEAPPTVSHIVQALLRTAGSLSQTALADAADVSERSVRRHLDTLTALDLVRETEHGYRFALSRPTSEERETAILPAPVSDTSAVAQDLVFDLVVQFLEDTSRLGNPSDPVGRQFVTGEYDWRALRTHLPRLDPWLRTARHLCDAPDPGPPTITFGPSLEQTSLTETTALCGGVG